MFITVGCAAIGAIKAEQSICEAEERAKQAKIANGTPADVAQSEFLALREARRQRDLEFAERMRQDLKEEKTDGYSPLALAAAFLFGAAL